MASRRRLYGTDAAGLASVGRALGRLRARPATSNRGVSSSLLVMARPLRFLPGKALVEVTCRTLHGRLLLRPSPIFNELLLGVLGRAQQRYRIDLVAIAVMSNHCHLLAVPDSAVQLAGFMQYFLGNLAREVGRLHDWRDKVFAKRYRAIQVSHEPEAQIARLRYLLENGTKEGLVAHPRDWPGVHSVAALLDGEELAGVWVDRTGESRARRLGQEVLPGEYETRQVVTLSTLPCWTALETLERRRRAAELVDDIAKSAKIDRQGRPVLGADVVLRQAPHERPRHCDRSSAPAVHAASKAVRIAMKAAYCAFLAAFRFAAKRLKAGDRLVQFPPGAFPPAMPAVAWAPS